MHRIKIPPQDFPLKMQGGLMREGGHICGTLQYLFIGASCPTLARLHCTDVCIRLCLRPYTINLKYTFKYFPKIECPRALAWQCWATARV